MIRRNSIATIYFVLVCLLLLWLDAWMRNSAISNTERTFIAVCEEHQEVIPYWMEMFHKNQKKQGENEKYILFHFDAHSDMAAPDYDTRINSFNLRSINQSYLPLMKYNDAFIVSSILIGLIDDVVWIKPRWLSEQQSYQVNGYVGIFQGLKKYCICYGMSCFFFMRDEASIRHLTSKECRPVKHYMFTVITEDSFDEYIHRLRVKTQDNAKIKSEQEIVTPKVILDFDEDYFGVKNRVNSLVGCGLTFHQIDSINYLLSIVFCPKTSHMETQINSHLLSIIKNIKNEDVNRTLTLSTLETLAPCKSALNDGNLSALVNILFRSDKNMRNCLLQGKFCLSSSPKFIKSGPDFMICHGKILPGQNLTEYHTLRKEEIDSGLQNVHNMIAQIFSMFDVSIVTVARSVRDGFTPVEYWKYIEKSLLLHLTRIMKRNGKSEHIHYDSNLLFQRNGWL